MSITTGYVKNHLCGEILLTLRNELAEFQIEHNFSTSVFRCLKSSQLTPKGKNCFLGLVAERLENGIELLDVHIESYDFQDPKYFLETLPPPKGEKLRVPLDGWINGCFDLQQGCDNLQLRAYVNELVQQIEFGFYDPITTYMEYFLKLNDKPYFLLQGQRYYVYILLVEFPIMFWFKHHQRTSSLQQLLDWLIWHFSIT